MIIVTNVKWPFNIIQGHPFWSQWPTRAQIILYSNVGFNSKASEDTNTERTEKLLFSTTQCRLTPPRQRTPATTHTNLILPETRVPAVEEHRYIFISFYRAMLVAENPQYL